ncbi:adenosine kinase [Candidatus Competibacter phosphatis]|uniref:Adenosine kinase n=1 Tax=Candidatus Competibacter phosphatis TaxID=221280 RepID=A0ABX1TQY9_9GAMM|nr:adenosine kinase [Candidatus Competibacter phosphatis]NMQ20429.1 adenosine kinase [Candidatus Competibacter phosphatis]
MVKYDVYGIGNALVDMEYEIEVADLETLGIDKGVMTLVDEQCQLRMMDHLAAHPHQRSSGGSAANSMIAVRQFGGTSFYSCKVAEDDLGHFYMKDLLDGGVDTNHHTEKEAGHTGRCVVLVTPDSDRTLCTFLGISGELSTKELVEDALRDSAYFYMEGYLVTSETARQACIAAKRVAEAAGVKTAISLSDPNMVRFFKAGLLEMIGSGVDLLFANEDEAKGVVGTADLDSAIDYLKTLSQEFVITRGSKGALVWDGQTLIDIDPVKVKAVDTVGAGDMFAGAFLYGRGRGWDHRRAGALASAASAKLVTSLGPRMSAAETQAVLHGLP